MHQKKAVPTGLSELARLLGMDAGRLTRLAVEAEGLYDRFPLRTRRRRPRWIEAPKPFLKLVQRRLLDRLLYGFAPHTAAHGFYPGLSIVTNARAHIRSAWVISFDLKDFFPTTDEEKVGRALRNYYSLEKNALEVILRLVCREGSLPQGAPTSPHLANLAFFKGDEGLGELAYEYGLAYTRYADDMTFSGNGLPDGFEDLVEQIVRRTGYRLAGEKTKRMGRHQCQKVTGLVVNEGVRLPRNQRRRLRAIRRDIETRGIESALARGGFDSFCELKGHLAFERMVGEGN